MSWFGIFLRVLGVASTLVALGALCAWSYIAWTEMEPPDKWVWWHRVTNALAWLLVLTSLIWLFTRPEIPA